MTKRRVFLALPNNHTIANETWQSVLDSGRPDLFVYTWRAENSLLAHNFNGCIAKCLGMGGFDYYAQIHADVGAEKGWLGAMVDELEANSLDALHAVVPIKNGSGLTSTAVAYSDDEWGLERRITVRELAELPTTFDINVIRERYDPNATRLLPNTGCLMLKCSDWLYDFPGFSIQDRITRTDDGKWKAEVVPEDWNFGHWAARNSVSVGGTKAVKITHWGRQGFPNDEQWGDKVDTFWAERCVA